MELESKPVPYAKLDDPQSLNLYGYVGNNPLGKADPDGHDGVTDALKIGAGLEVVAPELTPAIVVGVGVVALGSMIADHWDSIVDIGSRMIPNNVNGVPINYSDPGLQQQAHGGTLPSNAVLNTNSKSSSGPKASDAPGVTAGGQATDVHGNKLGPSGKPQVNKTQSNTRKGADDKAKSDGSGSVEHSNPTVGKPHFHPTDADGNKKPTSTHHEYPDK